MVNQIEVSSIIFGDSINRVIAWKNKNNQVNPITVRINGTKVQWTEWSDAYQKIIINKIEPHDFLDFLESYDRVIAWKNNNEQVNPKTIRVHGTTLE